MPKGKHRRNRGKHVKVLGKGLLGPTPRALKPRKKKQLRHQAIKTMRAVYRPALAELRGQERRVNAIANKRAEDNRHYLKWLSTQTEQLRAHAAASDAQLLQTQQQIQQSAQDSFQELRNQLVEQGGHEGGVSNPAQATAHDVTPEAQRATAQVAAERTRTAQQIGTGKRQANTAAASNFALMAAADAKRQADQWNALKDIASAKQKVQLEKAARTAEEIARLLDQEIAKAQARVQGKEQAAQVALGLKQAKLGRAQLKLDRQTAKAQLHFDRRQQRETERHNRASERGDRRSDRETERHNRAGERQDRRDNRGGNRADRREFRQERKKEHKATNRAIRNGIATYGRPKNRRERAQLERWINQQEGVNNPNLTARLLKQYLREKRRRPNQSGHGPGPTR